MKKIIFSLTSLIIFFVTLDAFAASAIDSVMCNASNIATGPAGKAFACFAIISVGIGFFTGRMSFGLMIGVSMGIATIYGAPTVVSALTGKALFECEDAVYNTVCEGDHCYSCPVGFSGENCDICATGFFGDNCSQCEAGYTGTNCSECIAGYYKVGGVCKMDCDVTGQNGVVDTVVHSGNGSLSCTLGNYSGSLSYTCDNNNFSVTKPCGCVNNYDATSSCTNCIAGYSLSSNCVDCESEYTKVNGICEKDCHVTGVVGIPNNTLAIPVSGTLACNSGSSGSINYSCTGGVFSTTQSCFVNSQCYDAGTHGTILMKAPAGKVWSSVVYAMYGAVSNCQEDNNIANNVLCSYPQKTVSVVNAIAAQCLNRNSCGVYINTFFASNLGVNVCDMRTNNASINRLNVILGY